MKTDNILHPLNPTIVKNGEYYKDLVATKLVADRSYTEAQGNSNTLNNLESVTDKLKGQILDIKV